MILHVTSDQYLQLLQAAIDGNITPALMLADIADICGTEVAEDVIIELQTGGTVEVETRNAGRVKTKALQNRVAAYQLLHQSVIREYQRAMHTDGNPGVGAAAEQMRVEIESLRASAELATARWKRSEAIRKAAIDQLFELALLIEAHESYVSILRTALIEIRQVANAPGDDIRAIVDSVLP